jgi:hypothetical protein
VPAFAFYVKPSPQPALPNIDFLYDLLKPANPKSADLLSPSMKLYLERVEF